MCLKDKRLCRLGWDLTQEWNSSMLGKFLITWSKTFSFSRTSACLYSPMLTFIQKTVGPLSLEWPSKVGEFAFRVMPDIIQISLMRTNLLEISLLKLLARCSTEPSKRPVTSWLTSSPSATAKPTSAWWTVHPSSKRLTKSLSPCVPSVSEKCPLTLALTVRSWSYTRN